jgi:hypothetical protein
LAGVKYEMVRQNHRGGGSRHRQGLGSLEEYCI